MVTPIGVCNNDRSRSPILAIKYIYIYIACCIFLLHDFHQSTVYNFCFPTSNIQEWFSQNHGHSMIVDLPSNLYHDYNWMGLILYASFSIHGDPNIIVNNLVSGNLTSYIASAKQEWLTRVMRQFLSPPV